MDNYSEQAVCDQLGSSAQPVIDALTRFLQTDQSNALQRAEAWTIALQEPLPETGTGLAQTLALLSEQVIPNGLPMARPGCSAYIMTAPTTAALMARLAASLASPQRFGQTAFHLLERQALHWLQQLFALPGDMQGLFTGGGSGANLVALGAARQRAYQKIGVDAAADGVNRPGRLFVSAETHRSIQKSAATLGLGRNSVQVIASDGDGRMDLQALEGAIQLSRAESVCPVAIIANAGATSTGVVDPIAEMAELARRYEVWLHVDGAYGLPGMLDARYAPQFEGVALADSVTVDPHKWLGTTIGVGAVFVRDRDNLLDAFRQEDSPYLQSAWHDGTVEHALLDFGEPFSDMGVELSSPARGVEVWAVLKEIGREGIQARICRHNRMALALAEQVRSHPRLELLAGPHLSICCFRYVDPAITDLNAFNRRLHRQLMRKGDNLPSTTLVNGQFAIRPCFISARADMQQVYDLAEDVVSIGDALCRDSHCL